MLNVDHRFQDIIECGLRIPLFLCQGQVDLSGERPVQGPRDPVEPSSIIKVRSLTFTASSSQRRSSSTFSADLPQVGRIANRIHHHRLRAPPACMADACAIGQHG